MVTAVAWKSQGGKLSDHKSTETPDVQDAAGAKTSRLAATRHLPAQPSFQGIINTLKTKTCIAIIGGEGEGLTLEI